MWVTEDTYYIPVHRHRSYIYQPHCTKSSRDPWGACHYQMTANRNAILNLWHYRSVNIQALYAHKWRMDLACYRVAVQHRTYLLVCRYTRMTRRQKMGKSAGYPQSPAHKELRPAHKKLRKNPAPHVRSYRL